MNTGDFSGELTGINLHRIWWTIIFSTLLNVAIIALNFLSTELRSPLLAEWQVADVVVSMALLAVTRWFQTHPVRPAWRNGLVAAYLLLALGFMDNYYFVLLHSHGHTSAYVLGVIAMGVILLLPPRLFIAIVCANHAIFCALLIASSETPRVKVLGITDGTCAVLVSALAAWFLYRAKRSDLRQQRVIAERNAELQLRNEEMGDVMAITAHDLRSPLQGVKHLLDFATPMSGSGRLTTALQTASQSCGDMLALIGRLLDAHAAEAASHVAEADLRDHFKRAMERAGALGAAKGVRLDLALPANPARASIDGGSLAQVLDNLLGNAIKFSPPGGTVTLTLDHEDGRWHGEVRDEGPGISPKEQASIFRKFHHGASGETGSGLGLFIVRKLMESMRGSVRYMPQEGGGAVFRIGFAPQAAAVPSLRQPQAATLPAAVP